ncbi:MAG: hypothetical protein AAFY03_00375 [Pseudomonadota bacterium]
MKDRLVRAAKVFGVLTVPTAMILIVDSVAGPRNLRPFSVAEENQCGPARDINNKPGICARVFWPVNQASVGRQEEMANTLRKGFRSKGLRTTIAQEERSGLKSYRVQFIVGRRDLGTFTPAKLGHGVELAARQYWMDVRAAESRAAY